MRFARVTTKCSACGVDLVRSAPAYLVPILQNAAEARCSKCEPNSGWHFASNVSNQEEVEQMQQACIVLGIPPAILNRAHDNYRLAQQRGLLQGRSRLGLLTASLYAACRQESMPVRNRDIAKVCRINVTTLNRDYRMLRSNLGLEIPNPDAKNFLSGLCQKLATPREVVEKAAEILNKAGSKGATSGRDPSGLAAASIYIACMLADCYISQADIAEAAGVTEVTLRNQYKNLRDSLGISIKARV